MIPLGRHAVAALKSHRERVTRTAPADLVFGNRSGKPVARVESAAHRRRVARKAVEALEERLFGDALLRIEILNGRGSAAIHKCLYSLGLGVEAPPGFEPGWRFCRAIPGALFEFDASYHRARNRICSIGCARFSAHAHRVWRWLKLAVLGSSRAQFGHSSTGHKRAESSTHRFRLEDNDTTAPPRL
jgi:hypothetical protein